MFSENMKSSFQTSENRPFFQSKYWPKGVPHQLEYDESLNLSSMFEESVANWADDTVSVIDGNTYEVLETLSVGSQPEALAVEADQNKAFVSNLLSSNVYVLDGNNGHGIIGIIPVQEVPGSLTVDEEHDWLFVTNTDAHSLSIVDVFSLHVLDTAPTQEFPLDVAVNPKIGTLYIIHRDQPALFVVDIVSE